MTQKTRQGPDGTSRAQKSDPTASKTFQDNPGQLKGRSPIEVEKTLDDQLVEKGRWTKSATRDGNGIRYTDGKGGSMIINRGYLNGMQGGDAVHQGPYVKIQPGGARVPLAGNQAASS